MSRERRNCSGTEKMAVLREYLIEKMPASEVCGKHGLQPTMFYGWWKKLFEEGAAVFEQPRVRSPRQQAAGQQRIDHPATLVRPLDEESRSHALPPKLPDRQNEPVRNGLGVGGLRAIS